MADDVKSIEHALRGLTTAKGRAVLIVEPNPDQQARLARLVAVRGHRVIGTTSIEGAVAFMRAFPVDLVLLVHSIEMSHDAEPLSVERPEIDNIVRHAQYLAQQTRRNA